MHSVTFSVIRVHFSPGCVHSCFIWAQTRLGTHPFSLFRQLKAGLTHTCHISVTGLFFFPNSPSCILLQTISEPPHHTSLLQSNYPSLFYQHDLTSLSMKNFHLSCNALMGPMAIKRCWHHTARPQQEHCPLVPRHHFLSLNYDRPHRKCNAYKLLALPFPR